MSSADIVNLADGRPDYAPWSTDRRMQKAVMTGLVYVQAIIHPSAIITQREDWEDAFFWNAVTQWSQETGVSHVTLPTAARDIMWMSDLDGSALGGTHNRHYIVSTLWLLTTYS